MKYQRDTTVRARCHWILAPALMALALVAHAQGAALSAAKTDSTGPQQSQSNAKSAPKLQRVIITGSRIAIAPHEHVEPTIILPAKTFLRRGYTDVGQALSELPSFGSQPVSQKNQQSAFSIGESFLDLYSLGSSRTLVLVNGRHFVPSTNGGSQVNLNNIPIQLIKRVETISIGGAPIYGAGAIAGTVNIITKQHYQGLSLRVLGGGNGLAGSHNYQFSLLGGHNFAGGRGNITAVAEYTYSDGIIGTQIPYFSANAGSAFLPSLPGSKYADTYVPNNTVPALTTSGVPYVDAFFLNNGAYSPNCAIAICNSQGQILSFFPGSSRLQTYDPGAPTGSPVYSSGGDGLAFDQFANLQARISRLNFDVLGHFQWNSHIRMFWSGWLSTSHNLSMTTQPGYETTLFAGPRTDSGPLVISVHNPFLSTADQTTIQNALLAYQANGYFLGSGFKFDPLWSPNYFYLDRASIDLQGHGQGDNDMLGRGVLGVKGDFTAFKRTFHWDVAAIYGYSRIISNIPDINFQNLQNALDAVVSPTGQIICAPGYVNSPFKTGSSTCAPLNPFGEGSPSAAARAYVITVAQAEQYDTERDITANITGQVIKVPGGHLKFAAGFANRREASIFNPSSYFTTVPAPGDLSSTRIAGSFTNNSFYVEADLPVFAPKMHIRALHRLSLEAAIRRVHNSVIGSANTYSYSIRWKPTRDVLFRYTDSHAIRDPAVTELFQPTLVSAQIAQDPCDSTVVSLQPDPAVTTKNCAAAGINTATFHSVAASASVLGTSGGNANLQPEIADSYTFGAVLTPRWVRHLRLSVNYINIAVKGAIESLNLTDMLTACYDSTAYPNVPECSLFTRDSSGQITNFHVGFVNAGLLDFQALTVALNYERRLPWHLGAVELDGHYMDTRALTLKIGAAPLINMVGQLFTVSNTNSIMPKIRGVFSVTYLKGPFSWYWQGQYSGSMNYDNAFKSTTLTPYSVHNWWVFNSSMSYQINSRVGVRLLLNNVFNKRPPYGALIGDAGVFTGGVQYYYAGIIGRTISADIHVNFF